MGEKRVGEKEENLLSEIKALFMPRFGLRPAFSLHRFFVRPFLSRDPRAAAATRGRQRSLSDPSALQNAHLQKKKKNPNGFFLVLKIQAKTISFSFFRSFFSLRIFGRLQATEPGLCLKDDNT